MESVSSCSSSRLSGVVIVILLVVIIIVLEMWKLSVVVLVDLVEW